MPNCLITGGAGFIGSHLAERLIARGDNVIVIDNLVTGSLEHLTQLATNRQFQFHQADVADDSAIAPLFEGIDHVYHLAAMADTRYLDYAGRINMSGNHLLSIISDLLDVSRIEIGAMELTEELVDLPDVIAASSNLIADRALRAGVTVALSPDPGLPRLRGDRLRVKQILLNLLSNAVKFTPLGGVIKVDVEIEEDGAVCLVVEDTGIGIPEHKIPEITQPFKQVESGFTRNQDGTGLGLTIAKSLIEMHDGSLHIASEIDQGTKVMVRFPAERAVHEALRSQES